MGPDELRDWLEGLASIVVVFLGVVAIGLIMWLSA
jgi:hypothetical protein